jgi:phenylacetate-CoA ligase
MMQAMELTVIVPCLNEAGNLPELVRRIGEVFRVGQLLEVDGGRGAELLLIDDGSTDASAELLAELCGRYPFLRSIRHPRNLGIAAAWKTGASAARGHLICLIDADLQYQPEDILRLRRELLWSNVDVIQGWRSPVGRERGPRYYYSRGLNFLLNAGFGMRLQDNKSGFILCAREVLLDLLDYRGSYAYWQTFILVAAHHKGYTYKEVETLFENRKAGVSFLDKQALKPILRTLSDLGRGLYEYRIRPARSSDLKPVLDKQRPLNRTTARSPVQEAYLGGYLSTFGATHWMMTRDVATHLHDLERSQWLPPEAVRELQEHKLRRLVRHAYQHVPYYRDRMRMLGISPEDIRTLDDLSRLPLVTKDDIRRHIYFDILSDNHDRAEILRVTTSGSTGEPFICYVDRAQLEFRWAATLRSQEWTGYRFGDRTMRLWHQTLGMSKTQVVRERLDAWMSRRRFIPAYEMSEQNLAELCREISGYRPVLIDGYAESFNFLAGYLQQHGQRESFGSQGLRGIMSSAQSLPAESRRIIEEAFGCQVFDKYGSREFSGIAYECEAHLGHHIVAEGYIVEVLKDGRPARPGEVGEIVITDLNNYCLPFIRYRIGDLGEAMDAQDACPCGRGLPRIGNIEGRVQSIILGAEGQYLPGTFFAHLFKDYAHAIRHFQVVQEEAGAIVLKIVKGERYTDEALNQLLGVLQRFLGASMRIEVDFVETIPMVRTGKRLAAVSKLRIDFQNLPKAHR